MHELALTQSILRIALTEAERHGAKRVLAIRIKVGVLSGVLPELIQEYYNIVSANTAAEKAEISVERVPATIECRDCGAKNEAQRFVITCPECGGSQIRLLAGREFYVDSLEVE